jgi:hypothetical protein
VSVVLSVGAFAISSATIGSAAKDIVEQDVAIQHHRGAYLAAGILQAIGVAVLCLVLRYLYRVVKYRREELPNPVWLLATIAPPLLAILALAGTFQQLHVVDQVVHSLPLSPQKAIDLAKHEQTKGAAVVIGIGGSLAGLSIAAAFILLSQNARRSGILSNFLGIIGIIVGAFLVLGPLIGSVLGPIPIVQWFWLAALAALFLGYWPNGRPPAWESGEAHPWPSAQEVREQRLAARQAEPEEEYEDEDDDEPDEEYDEPSDGSDPVAAHPRSKKRKRKRRR